MKKINIILAFSIICFFFSCGNDPKKKTKKEAVQPVSTLKPASEKIKKTASIDTVAVTKDLIKNYSISKKHISAVRTTQSESQIQNLQPAAQKTSSDIKKQTNAALMTFVNLRKILSLTKVGQTLTQKELTHNFKIPEEAVKLVKSITKTAENEIAVKWRSTWFVEKVSDAELEDGRMKVKFSANKLYTSGSAIGIKYNKKIYTNLIIIGRSAYIPSVKGYSWQIGR